MAYLTYVPTLAEIRRLCREYQQGWTEAEERSRRGVRGKTYYKCPRVPPELLRSGRMTDLELMEPTS